MVALPLHPACCDALVVMGVAGSGKSTLGQRCAQALGWRFVEGDDFHPPANVIKMNSGQALTDADRRGWLEALQGQLQTPSPVVLSCSALKRSYRDLLRAARPGLAFAHLALPQSAAHARVQSRPGHLFPPSLVASQFAVLEPPAHEASSQSFDACQPLDDLTQEILAWLSTLDSRTRGTAAPIGDVP